MAREVVHEAQNSVCKWIHPPKTNENVKKLKKEAIHQAIKKEYVAKANAQQQVPELKPFATNSTATINVQQVLSIPTEASPDSSGASFIEFIAAPLNNIREKPLN
ncbi:hypothetical protein P8452_43553 [Trifolium repens]|nr:hypothetical protein P8452_43553 [Trifolium repens]